MEQVGTTEATQETTTPEVTHAQPKQFLPVVYFSKGRRPFVTIFVGGKEKYFEFTYNGYCGVYMAQTPKDVKQIESSEWFGKSFFRAVDGSQIPSGRTKSNVIIGARNAMSGQINSSLPVDAQLNQLIEESKKTFQASGGR